MPEGPASVEAMADDAAGVLRALGIDSAHVAGFSGGSLVSLRGTGEHQLVSPDGGQISHATHRSTPTLFS
jgi:pimeloyl-ACP methyl ester carboxylesterase